ncbi:MAG TPA: holo-ACP synthase [Ruania sp.]|nr:holo-ACP synthase [Ruania sp.]
MKLLGVGTDLVAVARFVRLTERGGHRFLDRWFSRDEVAYALSCHEPARHIAARFAAKEAVLKSLRSADLPPPHWAEIEVTRDSSGLPGIRLHGATQAFARSLGVSSVQVTLAHDGQYATATAVAVVD